MAASAGVLPARVGSLVRLGRSRGVQPEVVLRAVLRGRLDRVVQLPPAPGAA